MFRLVSGFGLQDTMTSIVVPFLASATGVFLFRQPVSNANIDGALTDGPLMLAAIIASVSHPRLCFR